MGEFTIYCPRRGYLTHIDMKEQYPYVSTNLAKAKRFPSEHAAEKYKKDNDYLYWFRVEEIKSLPSETSGANLAFFLDYLKVVQMGIYA